MGDQEALEEVGERIEGLLESLRTSTEAKVWMQVEELVRLVTELYGAGLARIVELIGDDEHLVGSMARDELVASLLVLHDLHPSSFTRRVEQALDAVRPALQKGGAEAALTMVDPEALAVVVTVTGSASGCGSTGEAVRDMVRDALVEGVPDAESVKVALDLITPPTPVRLGMKPAAEGSTNGSGRSVAAQGA